MTQQDITDILRMRMAVYQAGINAGFWSDLNQTGASAMMDYLFPKSGSIAYYNLILSYMRKMHNTINGSVYFLFKLPVQIEKEIMDYMKKSEVNISTLVENADEYLEEMDTIVTDHELGLGIVNIGTFRVDDIDNMLRLCASHYRYAFSNHNQTYPYLS